ncbi:MAG: hypothetical protein WC139_12840 [Candidatus Kapaibacterium sp.]
MTREKLIHFAKWWMDQSYITCIVENEVDKYLKQYRIDEHKVKNNTGDYLSTYSKHKS